MSIELLKQKAIKKEMQRLYGKKEIENKTIWLLELACNNKGCDVLECDIEVIIKGNIIKTHSFSTKTDSLIMIPKHLDEIMQIMCLVNDEKICKYGVPILLDETEYIEQIKLDVGITEDKKYTKLIKLDTKKVSIFNQIIIINDVIQIEGKDTVIKKRYPDDCMINQFLKYNSNKF